MTSSFLPLLPNASFGGIAFPYEDYSVKGSLRHHVHEYPNRPGGDVEPLGRKLYEIAFTCSWHVNLIGWPGLIPGTLRAIRQLCETGSTYPLVVPDIGTIQAKAIEWPYSLSVKALSGAKITLKFLEHAQQTALVQPVQSVSLDSLQSAAAALLVVAEADPSFTMSLLDDIIDALAAVVALLGIAEVGDMIVQRRLSALMSACQAFCELPVCRPPRRYALVMAVRDVWEIAMLIASGSAASLGTAPPVRHAADDDDRRRLGRPLRARRPRARAAQAQRARQRPANPSPDHHPVLRHGADGECLTRTDTLGASAAASARASGPPSPRSATRWRKGRPRPGRRSPHGYLAFAR